MAANNTVPGLPVPRRGAPSGALTGPTHGTPTRHTRATPPGPNGRQQQPAANRGTKGNDRGYPGSVAAIQDSQPDSWISNAHSSPASTKAAPMENNAWVTSLPGGSKGDLEPKAGQQQGRQHHHQDPANLPVLHQHIQQVGQRRHNIGLPHILAHKADHTIMFGRHSGPTFHRFPGSRYPADSLPDLRRAYPADRWPRARSGRPGRTTATRTASWLTSPSRISSPQAGCPGHAVGTPPGWIRTAFAGTRCFPAGSDSTPPGTGSGSAP